MNARLLFKIIFVIFIAAAFTFSLWGSHQHHWFYTEGFYPFFFGYTFGSIPFGYLLTRFFEKTDIRKLGSGNIGATNVLRTGRKGLAAMTLLLDGMKGAVAVWTTLWLYKPYSEIYLFTIYLVALGALLGHIFPIWLNFKGGKGVATAFGLLLVLSWPIALAALATWILVAAIFRYSSLAALTTTTLVPLYAYLVSDKHLMLFSFILNLLIFISHYGNIKRLIQKQEPKIGCKPQSSLPQPPH
ncbi:MAG: glycerol-3-phosphate 1-O-acyltransferase PlsY [Alphaproteobacteria bacterium]|nr:glycerol-3-phosphate 1-O-acyltransferase PlsY [Alphaproteobacteria bacterium]